jgi:hypothetical protein
VSLRGVNLDVLGVVVLGEGSWGDGVQEAIVLEQSTDVYRVKEGNQAQISS